MVRVCVTRPILQARLLQAIYFSNFPDGRTAGSGSDGSLAEADVHVCRDGRITRMDRGRFPSLKLRNSYNSNIWCCCCTAETIGSPIRQSKLCFCHQCFLVVLSGSERFFTQQQAGSTGSNITQLHNSLDDGRRWPMKPRRAAAAPPLPRLWLACGRCRAGQAHSFGLQGAWPTRLPWNDSCEEQPTVPPIFSLSLSERVRRRSSSHTSARPDWLENHEDLHPPT